MIEFKRNFKPTHVTGQLPEGLPGLGAPPDQQQIPDIDAIIGEAKATIQAELQAFIAQQMAMAQKAIIEDNLQFRVNVPTRNEIKDALTGIVKGAEERYAAKSDVAATQLSQTKDYVTRQEAVEIARDAVPPTIRDIDNADAQRTGDVLKLQPGGENIPDSAYWGTVQAGSGETLSFYFKASKVAGTDTHDSVQIGAGLVQEIGYEPILSLTTSFVVTANCAVYIPFTYAYPRGAWGSMACATSLPEETATTRIIRIADIFGAANEAGYFKISSITQAWFGTIHVHNVSRCT